MLYLFTGTPGASKTLNAIKFICEDDNFSVLDGEGKPTTERRPVYYFNVKEVTHPWTELTEDECRKWYELPAGAVVFIDECQKIFRPRAKAAAVPKYVEELETHRHLGIDIVVCTQATNLVDSNLLAFVEQHRHFERRHGEEKSNCFQWEKAITSVNAKSHRNQALMTTVTFDKKYYGTYKSAEIHTRKKSVPLKIRLLQGFIVLTAVLFVSYFLKLVIRFDDEPEPEIKQLQHAPQPLSRERLVRIEQEAEDPFIPRIKGLDWTAPMYDEVMEVRSAPRPNACIHWRKRDLCVCSSQQGSHMDIPRDVCMGIVKRGFFDYTREDVKTDTLVRNNYQPEPPRQSTRRSLVYLADRTPPRAEFSEPRSYSTGAVTKKTIVN